MLNIGAGMFQNGHGMSRRALLQVGGLGVLGLSVADWWRSQEVQANPYGGGAGGREPSCIFIFLSGGPSHFETFDPKPNAPVNIRGPYDTIPTSMPGTQISELLPQMARHMNRCTLIRSMTSKAGDHSGMAMLSGMSGHNASYGAVLSRLKGSPKSGMPGFVHVGPSGYLPGAGNLGPAYNAVLVADPSGKQAPLPQFGLSADVSPDRFKQRGELLGAIDKTRAQWHETDVVGKMDVNYQRAVDMLTSDKVRNAFDLAKEKEALRSQYGGSVFGQSCLMARRLVEAGTRFVQVNWYSEPAWHGWDVHGADLPGIQRMESPLCPRLDQGLSTLLEDLSQRGLLSSTLVVVTGEFGRSPQINKYGGRDHWPQCFSVLLAGGGVRSGAVIGASDRHGGYPVERPVSVPELAATLYRLLGVDTTTDPRVKPFIGDATPVSEVV
ncbi:MAG: DUF1501 domain-containing protein [Gemmataceae bacterium]|nr:DUF1501 domain-containing protein [Gemmataceae bacterium]